MNGTRMLFFIRRHMMIMALVLIWGLMAALTRGIFIAPGNLSNLFLQTVTVGIAACGMTLIIVAGHIDLSVGSVAGFTGAVAAVLQVRYGWNTSFAIAGALFAGLLIGVWHGYWIALRRVPAFIVTLASMLAFRGAILGVTGGATVSPLASSFKSLGTDYVPPVPGAVIAVVVVVLCLVFSFRARLFALSAAALGFFAILLANEGIPYSVLLLLFIVILFEFISRRTVFGRHIYAIGGNCEAARLSGVNVRAREMLLFPLFGVIVAVSGVVMTARLNAATTSAGVNMELDAIAACVIGGTSLMGGEGSITGAIIGALIMSSLDNGMSLMNLDITYQYVIKGLILMLAVWADISTRRAR